MREALLTGNGQFEGAVSIAYYGGAPIALEAKLAHAALSARKPFRLEVPSVPGMPAGVSIAESVPSVL